MTDLLLAVVVDIVGSRRLDDRARAQRAIQDVFLQVEATWPAEQPLRPTVGDEFQVVYADVATALRATTLARLLFPAEVDCRFGLGWGEVTDIDAGQDALIQDGSAWWRARAAIDEAHRREDKRQPYLRSWFEGESPQDGDAIVNALLTLRDHTIDQMRNPRQRQLAAGALLGRSQESMAADVGISQSAVSQNLQRSGGAALVSALDLLAGAPTR
ncbi:SatD family protein [Plantibacter cousiniae (nom. nud.)]|uniref:SatD family protein n=1 Tax=Plantibacter cousiniae (nom. nud.) TaxID=199709 RepID=UPI001D1BC91F|nr:SatD family protein [Plantibacter cousiniae]CAH0198806.1 hypothetical protein SRABI02_01911 [Plantibacter cousiniae]